MTPTQSLIKPWDKTPMAFAFNTLKDQQIKDAWGHSPDKIDVSKTFWVLLQNPNGIKLNTNNTEFMLSLQESYDSGTAVIRLTETNISWTKYQNRQNLRESLNKLWPHTAFSTSNSSETFESNFQPGGTITIATDHWTH